MSQEEKSPKYGDKEAQQWSRVASSSGGKIVLVVLVVIAVAAWILGMVF